MQFVQACAANLRYQILSLIFHQEVLSMSERKWAARRDARWGKSQISLPTSPNEQPCAQVGGSPGDAADSFCRMQQKSFWEWACVNEQAFDVEIRPSQSGADTVASQPRYGAALLPTTSSIANNLTAPAAAARTQMQTHGAAAALRPDLLLQEKWDGADEMMTNHVYARLRFILPLQRFSME